jgi:hypothetical protein
MYEIILENAAGDRLYFNQNTALTVVDIQGLNPPTATINTSQIALIDGAKYNSAKLDMRTINIAFAIEYDAPAKRIAVYDVLKSKQYVKMYYNGDYRKVYIEGYIQSIDITYFAMKQIVTCAILCPSPYFKEAQAIVDELRSVISSFHFPFASTEEPELVLGYVSTESGITIENDGDVDCGMIITLFARDAVTNPRIFNYVSREYFGLNISMQQGDYIYIDTRQGHKTVTLLRGGQNINIFNYVTQGSTWLQLADNGSTFVYEIGSGNMLDLVVTFTHENLYEGV